MKEEIKSLFTKDKKKAKHLQRFFKTGKGQYGEGDVFIGMTMPQIRSIAKANIDMSYKNISSLIKSKVHEHRMCGLVILTYRYEKFSDERDKIYNFYLKHRKGINNWDLIDITTPKIVGNYLLSHNRSVLYEYVKGDLWERRIAVLACFAFIRNDDFKDIHKIAKLLLNDSEDLIHKAVGWMLREMGKRDVDELYKFLDKYYKKMPRTMLRYSIERIPKDKKEYYMKK